MQKLNLEKLVKNYVSKDELKPALLGAVFNREKNEICVTDGHKLFVLHDVKSHITIVCDEMEKGNDPILPAEIFLEIEKRTKRYNREYIIKYCRLLITGNGSLDFPYFVEYQERKSDSGEYRTFAGAECITEGYPDYQSVIPENKRQRGQVMEIGVNPSYLNMMYEGVKSWRPKAGPCVTLHIESEISPIMVEFWPDRDSEGLDYTALLMPVRGI